MKGYAMSIAGAQVSETPRRIKNYFYARQRWKEGEELEWVRPEKLVEMTLPRPLVIVNGAFDLLHTGHMKLIFAARNHAGPKGCVVVCLDSDEKVRSHKGLDRPILKWHERAAALAYMPVDYLCEISSEGDMNLVVNGLGPDLRVQGMAYLGQTSRYPDVQKMLVNDSGMSTSEIVRRVKGEKI